MKIFKLATAALVLAGFASCSEVDDFSSKGKQAPSFTSELQIDVEEPDGFIATRAARNANAGGFSWQEGDNIRVYDVDLGVFDTYTFADKFGREGATKLTKDPKYALFPAESVRKGYFDGNTHVVEIKIGTLVRDAAGDFNYIEYSKDSGAETKVGDDILYQFGVPMWGEATKIDANNVKATLNPLTGVLYATLTEALNNASWLKLHSESSMISGTLYADLDAAEPSLYVNDADEYTDLHHDLYIDLRNLPSNKAVLYIPVPAGVNDLIVSRAEDKNNNPATIAAANWTTVTNLSGYTFKRNGYKKFSYEYPMAAKTPEQLSLVLDQLNTQTENLTLKLADKLYLDLSQTNPGAGAAGKQAVDWNADGNADNDETLYMPNMACEEVTIDIDKDVAGGNLYIQDADAEDPFTGTLIIKQSTTAFTGAITCPSINLPKATVQFVGNFANSTFVDIIADNVIFGDGSTATAVSSGSKTTKFDLGDVQTSIQVLKSATVTGRLNSIDALTNFAPYTIKGKVDGDIYTKGDVTIDLPAKGEAVTGAIAEFRGETSITMKQGYVGEIISMFRKADLGEANDHSMTIKMDDANGITAIKSVTNNNDGTTYWADSKINITESKLSTAAKDLSDGTFNNYISGNKVYTAAQLEALHKTDATTAQTNIVMCNSVDMANAAWTAPFGNATTAGAFTIAGKDFNGNDAVQTIKNLSYNGYKASVQGVGFVGKVTNLTASFITFDNISFTKVYLINQDDNTKSFEQKFIGGVAGEVTGTTSLTSVTVGLANGFGYSDYQIINHTSATPAIPVNATLVGIGGLVGKATGAATLSKVAVTGDLIQGYTSIGGFIGLATDNVTINNASKSNITAFKSNFSDPAAENMQMNFGRIAGGVGYMYKAGSAAGNFSVANNCTTNTVSVSYKVAGSADKLYVRIAAGTGSKLYTFSRSQQWVGFSGTEDNPSFWGGAAQTTATIGIAGTANYVVPTFNAAGALDALASGKTALYTWTEKAN